MYKNSEGYPDPTAGAAYSAIRQEERQHEADRLAAISALIPVMKGAAELDKALARKCPEDISSVRQSMEYIVERLKRMEEAGGKAGDGKEPQA